MRCRKARSYLSAYCREELDSRRQLAVSDHLMGCESCRCEEAVYRQMNEAVSEIPEMAVSDDFNARLLNRIAEERFAETRTKAYMPKRAPLMIWRQVVPVAVASCLALIAMISMMPSGEAPAPGQMMAHQSGLDDSYLTAQPGQNPNVTVNLRQDWSLDQAMARTQRFNRISDAIVPVSSSSQPVLNGAWNPLRVAPGEPIPYMTDPFRMRSVVRIYVAPNKMTTSQEGDKSY